MRVGAGDRVLQPPVGLVCVEEALEARSRACKATHTRVNTLAVTSPVTSVPVLSQPCGASRRPGTKKR